MPAARESSGAPLAAIGDFGGDGRQKLVVAQVGGDRGAARDLIEMYGIQPESEPQMALRMRVFPSSSAAGISEMLAADVDPTSPGVELLVVDEPAGRRNSARVKVLGGAQPNVHRPVGQFRVVRSRNGRSAALTLAAGNVLAETTGDRDIVVGDALGWVSVYRVRHGRTQRLRRYDAFPEIRRATAARLAVGNLLPDRPGDEIVVGDDGTRGDGTLRVMDGREGHILLEVAALGSADARDGLRLWVGDVIANLPGDELIVGQGAAGGKLCVYSFADGNPRYLFDVRDDLPRLSTLQEHVAIGNLLPGLSGAELAVAQPDPRLPLQIFHLSESGATLVREINIAGEEAQQTVGSLVLGN